GETIEIQTAIAIPAIKEIKVAKFHFSMCFKIKNDEAIISPKKKDHKGIGWFTSRYSISLASERILIITPPNTEIKKEPLIFSQNNLMLPLSSNPKAI